MNSIEVPRITTGQESCCPSCGSIYKELKVRHYKDNKAIQTITCVKCNYSWKELWSLNSWHLIISELQEGSNYSNSMKITW